MNVAPPTSYTQAPRTCVQTLLHILLKAALHSLHSPRSQNFSGVCPQASGTCIANGAERRPASKLGTRRRPTACCMNSISVETRSHQRPRAPPWVCCAAHQMLLDIFRYATRRGSTLMSHTPQPRVTRSPLPRARQLPPGQERVVADCVLVDPVLLHLVPNRHLQQPSGGRRSSVSRGGRPTVQTGSYNSSRCNSPRTAVESRPRFAHYNMRQPPCLPRSPPRGKLRNHPPSKSKGPIPIPPVQIRFIAKA